MNATPAGQQPDKQPGKKKSQTKVDPKTFRPDAATQKQIEERTEELRKAIAALKEKKIPDDVLVEVEIYLKAAENIVRFDEWFTRTAGSGHSRRSTRAWTARSKPRAARPSGATHPGKWVVRAYRSKIDDSIQPYAVLLPHDYGKDPKKKWRLDIVLHGRDGSLTEAKFIATHERRRTLRRIATTSNSKPTAAATTRTAGPARRTCSEHSNAFR